MNFAIALVFAFIVAAFAKPHHKGNSSSSSDADSKHKRHHHKHGSHHHTLHPRRSTSATIATSAVYEPSTEAVTITSDRIVSEGVATNTVIAVATTKLEQPITRAEPAASTKLILASTMTTAEAVTQDVIAEVSAAAAASTQAEQVSKTDASTIVSEATRATTGAN